MSEFARRTEARRDIDCAAADLEILDRLGGRLITAADADGHCAPFTLFPRSRRTAARAGASAAGVVGGRRGPAPRGRRGGRGHRRDPGVHGVWRTRRGGLRDGLADRDVAVVSGGAYGIDGAAHRRRSRPMASRWPCWRVGSMCPIRRDTRRCCAGSLRRACCVSEYPPGLRPARYRFLTRNRLVAALAGATVVVEAGLRSGAANTAAWARALGRPVCAVPGPVTSSASAGCHALRARRCRTGHPRRRGRRIGRTRGRIGAGPGPAELTARRPDRSRASRVRRVAARGAGTADQVAVAAGMPATQVLGPLATLELVGLVNRQEGRWKLAVREVGRATNRSLRTICQRTGDPGLASVVVFAGRPTAEAEPVAPADGYGFSIGAPQIWMSRKMPTASSTAPGSAG